jgi:hypothetical protein
MTNKERHIKGLPMIPNLPKSPNPNNWEEECLAGASWTREGRVLRDKIQSLITEAEEAGYVNRGVVEAKIKQGIRQSVLAEVIEVGEGLKINQGPLTGQAEANVNEHNYAISDYQDAIKKLI